MDPKERAAKMHYGLRRNQGRLRMAEFLEGLSQALGRPGNSIELLSLEQTDELLTKFESALPEHGVSSPDVFHGIYPISAVRSLEHALGVLKARGTFHNMVLFRELSHYCGAIRTNSEELLVNALRLVDLNESLVAMTEVASHGIVLHYDDVYLRSNDSAEYDLTVWGADWVEAVAQPIDSP